MTLVLRALFIALLAWTVPAQTAEAPVKILTPAYVRAAIVTLKPVIEAQTGVSIVIETVGTGGIVQRLQKGEAGDLVITSKDSLEPLQQHLLASQDVAVSVVGIAVADNMTLPPLRTPDDLIAFLKATPSFAYSTGPSGQHMARVIAQLGLTETMAPKSQTGSGLLGTRIIKGEVAAVAQQVSELKLAGLKNFAALPDAVKGEIPLTAATVAGTSRADVVEKIVQVLASAAAAKAYEDAGLMPAAR